MTAHPTTAQDRIAFRHARRRGLDLSIQYEGQTGPRRIKLVWSDPREGMRRVLMSTHRPCVVCARQTRWAATHHVHVHTTPFPRYCSYACLRTRPPS